jgi:hypothetical protein
LFANQVGGSNASGAFGSGAMSNLGTQVGLALADSGPGGGSASYAIGAGNITYTVAGAPIAAGSTYGAYLTMAGSVPLVGNADVLGLRVHISDTAGVFGAGGTDLPQLVLAISRNGAGAGIGNYNVVAIGGVAGGNAALILDNGLTGSFRALAVDNQGPRCGAAGRRHPLGLLRVDGLYRPCELQHFRSEPLDRLAQSHRPLVGHFAGQHPQRRPRASLDRADGLWRSVGGRISHRPTPDGPPSRMSSTRPGNRKVGWRLP